MSKIKSIVAREILDSRGNPTVEVDVISENGLFSASVPSGASTGDYEAVELRDNDKNRYNGKGVLKAVNNVSTLIAGKLIGKDVTKQKEIDELMIKLDGTKNKSKLGANAILGVSMAVCRAGAAAKKQRLYRYIGKLCGNSKMVLPVPSFNIINGGRHAKNKLSFQEFMILPVGASSFFEAMKMGSEIYIELKKIIGEKYGKRINIGDEGGFAPNIINNIDALNLLERAIKNCKYSKSVKIGIDAAASEFFEKGRYNLGFKGSNKNLKNSNEMIKVYKKLVKDYGIISIEDPFDQNDWNAWKSFNKKFGKKIQIVGDDLLVTNVKRVEEAIFKTACNTLLLKINQVGTITEAINAFKIAKKAGWNVMVSHRSGETKDSFIADLVVGLGAGEIKSGAPFPIERLAKYSRLIEIEKELGKKAEYFGKRIL